MKKLETERLIIREFEKKDAEQAHKLFSDREAMRLLGMLPELKTLSESEKRVEEWMNNQKERKYAVIEKETDFFVGYVAVNPDSEESREDTRELAFGTCNDCRRKGYMKEAVTAILQGLKEEGITYVWACCFKGNDASEKLIRALNFELQQEGTFEAENDRTYASMEYRITLN